MTDEKSEEVIDGEKPEKTEKDEVDVLADLQGADGVVVDTGEDKPEIQDEKKAVVIEEDKKEVKKEEPDDKSEVGRLRSDLDRIRRDKSDLKKALHEERQKNKKKEDEPVLTETELAKIVEEHKDDPAVLMNAVKYMVQQQVKGVKKEAVDEVEVKAKKEQFNTVLRERYKDFDDEDSPIRKSTEKAKEIMGLKDHPYGDVLGAAVTVFANQQAITKYWFEEGKKAATDEKVNTAREKQIADGKVTPPGSKSTVAISSKTELSDSQMSTFEQGFAKGKTPEEKARLLKIYRTQILKK